MAGMFGQRGRERLASRLAQIPEDGQLPMGNPKLETPAPIAPRSGQFGAAPIERNWLSAVGAGFSDFGHSLRGANADQVDNFLAGEKKAQDDADWGAELDGMDLEDSVRDYARTNPAEFKKQQYEKSVSDADRLGRFKSIVDSGVEIDPMDLVYAQQDPDGYMKLRFTDHVNDQNYDRTRGDAVTDRDLLHDQGVEAEERKANRPRIDNTGQAIVMSDPVTGKARVLYRDEIGAGAGGKTFQPLTPAQLAQRGYPKGATGQIDSTGRVYIDPPRKAQSEFSSTEIRGFRDKSDGLIILRNAVENYVSTLEKMGGPQLLDTPMNAKNTQSLKTAHAMITSAIKQADTLGALDQGVQNLVNAIIQDPVGLGTWGKTTESIKEGAQQLYDGIDFKLSRVPEQYRNGSTGKAPELGRPLYTPDEVTQAKLALQNWDHLPSSMKTPQSRALAEKVAGNPRRQPDPEEMDDDPTDDEYDNALDSHAGNGFDEAPPGVAPSDWDELSDEEKQQYIEEAAGR